MGTNEFPADWRAAVDDLTMLDLPASDRTADPRGAPGLLRESLSGDETLISLGPLTNVAMLLRAAPGAHERIRALKAPQTCKEATSNPIFL